MSFRLKTILGIALIEALLLTVLIISGLYYLSSSNEQQLLQRAHTTAKLVATMTADAVVAVDLATLDVLVEQTLRNPDIVYLRIRNAKKVTLSQGGSQQALTSPFKADASIDEAKLDKRLDVQAPIIIAGNNFGQVELGLSTQKLQSTLSDAFRWMAGIAISEMLLVALMGLMLGTYLTQQLKLLMIGSKRVAEGDFGHQIPVKGKDELAETALSFNRMSRSLKEYAQIAEEARKRAEAGRERAESILQDALDSMRDGVLIIHNNGQVALANEAFCKQYQIETAKVGNIDHIMNCQAKLHKQNREDFIQNRLKKINDPISYPRWETELINGQHFLIAQHPMSKGGVVIVETDVTELYEAQEENRQLQLELMQKHKTDALGTLAGGMAHEINTPVQFISDNVTFIAEGVSEIFDMIDEISKSEKEAQSSIQEKMNSKLEEIDWDFLREEMPSALNEMSKGADRVKGLIAEFKQFAAPNSEKDELTDLAKAVQMTIDISKAEWEKIAKIKFKVIEDMPLVPCKPAQINQTIQSLLSNAIHAIEDCNDQREGAIEISLGANTSEAWLQIKDNGCGIPEEHCQYVFDTLFTTKEPGRGTGNGLALCHTIINRNHKGKLTFKTALGVGTTFTITLPLKHGIALNQV